ncbi:MAG TPA: hypothetical protein VMO47_13225, partial [Rhodothermales bacterium]|nr:hypothetical protein [Rhodothermales bacterium]
MIRRTCRPSSELVRTVLLSSALVLVLFQFGSSPLLAQEGSSIPDEYRGTAEAVARGILDGNLIETNYRNHGELARWNDWPWGIWPRSIGGRHIDGVAVIVAGLVRGQREAYSVAPYNFWPSGTPDTLLNPVSIHYRSAGTRIDAYGRIWGWLPLNGFHNDLRRSPITSQREPVPAISDDPTSWPAFWPDKLLEEDSGWPGSWNGMFGKGVFSADLESFYVMDDFGDLNYAIDSQLGTPFSQHGIFYPDPNDPTEGGLGLQMNVRILQWANVLAEDAMFLIYRITNKGATNYGEVIDLPRGPTKTGLWFAQFVDYGLGNEEGDENAAFNPLLDIAYGWDQDGIGQHMSGGTYKLGYTGFAFLESPTNQFDGLDNDQDGITDELRFGGPGFRIEGRDEIRAYVEANYNTEAFVIFNGDNGETFDEVLASRPAYRAGVWWTGDEDLDWVGFEDKNGNGVVDPGELINDDVGRDGLGPFDPGYPGPDLGEADGIPTIREPNFDELDVDESDQIGLTGFHLSSRPFYEAGDNLRDDTWMWARIIESQFELGHDPQTFVADVEPFLNFSSGPVTLGPNNTDFFSTAWLFGEDEADFFRNRQTVQRIYNADYRFAQPPIVPTLKAQEGDGYIVLSWDTLSLASYDRFTQEFDFEGYKLYKGTDNLLSDARNVTNVYGIPVFNKPIAQWDLINGIRGTVPVMENTAIYDLGDDTGLEFSYIDRNVTNGKTYYYVLVAYDRGFIPGPDSPNPDAAPVDPQENAFNISVDQAGQIRGLTPNAVAVVPRSRAAGYVEASANEDLSRVTEGIGTGSASVTVVNNSELRPDVVYRLLFRDTTATLRDIYETTAYQLMDVTSRRVVIPWSPMTDKTPSVDGFVVAMQNDGPGINQAATGWAGMNDEGEFVYQQFPFGLEGYSTNWFVQIEPDDSQRYVASPYEYELRWKDSLYTTPTRRYAGHLSGVEIPVWCTNLTTNEACDLFVRDLDENGELDLLSDALVIADLTLGVHRFRHVVTFSFFGTENTAPTTGNYVKISTFRPFSRDDYFEFTVSEGHVDEEM